MLYRYEHLKHRLSYKEAKQLNKETKTKKSPHIGQLKLFLTELLFLSKKSILITFLDISRH